MFPDRSSTTIFKYSTKEKQVTIKWSPQTLKESKASNHNFVLQKIKVIWSTYISYTSRNDAEIARRYRHLIYKDEEDTTFQHYFQNLFTIQTFKEIMFQWFLLVLFLSPNILEFIDVNDEFSIQEMIFPSNVSLWGKGTHPETFFPTVVLKIISTSLCCPVSSTGSSSQQKGMWTSPAFSTTFTVFLTRKLFHLHHSITEKTF